MGSKHFLYSADVNEATKRQKNNVSAIDEFDDLEDTVQFHTKNTNITDSDLYLDTINRKVLNFDMPIECRSTLTTTNIYICLVCNKYLQGGSINSPAYMHAVDTGHHIFINTKNSDFILLPEHLTLSKSRADELRDIKLLLDPTFDEFDFDKTAVYGQSLSGQKYHVGFIPLVNDAEVSGNNISIAHNMLYYALLHLSCLRDVLLKHNISDQQPLTNELSKLTKKLWSKYLFRNITSSYSIENFFSKLPEKVTSDLRMFYLWIVSVLAKEEKKTKDIFTGKLELQGKPTKFTNITVTLPQPSIFKDGTSTSIEQYDLKRLIDDRGFRITRSPKVLVIYIDRSNNMKIEGINQTLNTNVVKYDPNLLQLGAYKYKLAANITYDNKVHVLDKANEDYKEFDSISIKKIEKELLFISNCKLQFWELI